MKATTYLSLLFCACSAFAQGSLEVIELRHTTAELVIPSLRPLLEPGSVLTGQRSQLIVRTSARNLAELRRALEVLDRPARRLEISVRFDSADSAERSTLDAAARISNRGSRVEIRKSGSRGAEAERVDQRLQVLEGGRALIATGESRPLQLRDGVIVQEIANGFVVVPRLAGDMVILDIAPQRQSPAAAGSVQAMGAATTVRARLGEWVELGGVEAASRGRVDSSASRRIWVKVEEIRL